jgi:hypothetical protein
MKITRWGLGLVSVAGLLLSARDADAFLFHHCCGHCCETHICCRPYNAFTPICWGNIHCDGCCMNPCSMCNGYMSMMPGNPCAVGPMACMPFGCGPGGCGVGGGPMPPGNGMPPPPVPPPPGVGLVPGAAPPGFVPPGAMPPGAMPPGAMPPGAPMPVGTPLPPGAPPMNPNMPPIHNQTAQYGYNYGVQPVGYYGYPMPYNPYAYYPGAYPYGAYPYGYGY